MSNLKLRIWPDTSRVIHTRQRVFLPDGTEIPNVVSFALSGGGEAGPSGVTLQLMECEAERVDVKPPLSPGMKTIPVLMNFDQEQPIGFMTLDMSKLPPGADYVFALGYEVKRAERLPDFGVDVKEAELLCVSLQTDMQYAAYLKQQGG